MKRSKCALSAGRFAAAHAGMKTEHITISHTSRTDRAVEYGFCA
jgi:hypothetical protein